VKNMPFLSTFTAVQYHIAFKERIRDVHLARRAPSRRASKYIRPLPGPLAQRSP